MGVREGIGVWCTYVAKKALACRYGTYTRLDRVLLPAISNPMPTPFVRRQNCSKNRGPVSRTEAP